MKRFFLNILGIGCIIGAVYLLWDYNHPKKTELAPDQSEHLA